MKKTPTKVKDNAFKVMLDTPELFVQFLEDFIDIPLLKNIDASDIEDISERFLPLISENKDGDTIKKIHLKGHAPLFVVSIIEHQQQVNYRMSFRLLQYIVYVLVEYEKEHKDTINRKDFKYPPVLPIVFYDGKTRWTAEKNFLNKVAFHHIFEKYIPKFEYLLVNLNAYSNVDLMNKEDALSFIMLIDKLTSTKEFTDLRNLPADYLRNLEEKTPQYLIEVMRNMIDLLMIRQNVPDAERKELTDKILERRFSDMFAWADNIDIQAERKKTADAQKKTADAQKKTADAQKKAADAQKKAQIAIEKAEIIEKKLQDECRRAKDAEARIKELEALLDAHKNKA